MNRFPAWKLATIRGIDLKVHFSLVFLLFYVTLIAAAQFPLVVEQSGINPEILRGSSGLWAGVFSVGLFLSIALHEFGHAIVAQSLGVKVKGITLMMLGGVSEMERMPEERYAEFKISVVGPLVSLGIAGLLFALMSVTNSNEIDLFCYWLGRVNLVLAIFNLIPAFPLDGGRVFRSLLSVRQGKLRATQNATQVAKAFAWILGILGFLGFNILLILIAFFIYAAANNELNMSLSQDLLKGVKAGEVGVRTETLFETDSLVSAFEKMVQGKHRILPVRTWSQKPAILHYQGLKKLNAGNWEQMKVRDFMTGIPKVLNVDDPIDRAIPELATHGAIPLEEGGALIGLVHYKDLLDFVEFKGLETSIDPSSKKKHAA